MTPGPLTRIFLAGLYQHPEPNHGWIGYAVALSGLVASGAIRSRDAREAAERRWHNVAPYRVYLPKRGTRSPGT